MSVLVLVVAGGAVVVHQLLRAEVTTSRPSRQPGTRWPPHDRLLYVVCDLFVTQTGAQSP